MEVLPTDDDDVVIQAISVEIEDDVFQPVEMDPKYPWFQRPAPTYHVTFLIATIFFAITFYLYRERVDRLKEKFGEDFTGSLRICAKISAYMDNREDPRFAVLRLCTKSWLFLAFLQINFHVGFWIMWALLVLECSLDIIRVVLAYNNCNSLQNVSALSDEEAQDMKVTTELVPTNIYEDLTRPKSIAVMVFIVQVLLIGLVMNDTYQTETRTCFDGNLGCPMLTSLGSYCLYLMGAFMACVFYVGPGNSYGAKELNHTFWLKLFLMSKEHESYLSWKDSLTDTTRSYWLEKHDYRIILRFFMSSLVNGAGFLFLLHILPIQIAGQSTIIGVVFRAVGMIYLTDLDDAIGDTMTLVTGDDNKGSHGGAGNGDYGSALSSHEFNAEKDRIIGEAVKEVQTKLEALMAESGDGYAGMRGGQKSGFVSTITGALFQSTARRRHRAAAANAISEETPLTGRP